VQFVTVLNVAVLIVALPVIGRDLAISESGLRWLAGIYSLGFGALLLPAGRAADSYGRRSLVAVGMGLFAAMSLLCAAAPSPGVLIVGRAIQGVGAAVAVPAALAMVTALFPGGAERRQAIGVWTAAAAGGGALGFVLGGLITDWLGWRAIFVVNGAIGIVAVVVALRLLPHDRAAAPGPLDWPGTGVITTALLLLILGLSEAGRVGLRPLPLAAVGAAIALGVVFALVERRTAAPLLPPRFWRVRRLIAACGVSSALTASTGAIGVLATLYLQDVLHRSAAATGLVFVPFSLAVIAGSFAGSRLDGRGGSSLAVVVGLTVLVVAMLVLMRIEVDGGVAILAVGQALAGFGLGCASVGATHAGMAAVDAADQGLASGLLNSAAQVGTAVGIAGLVAVASARTAALGGDGAPADAELVAGYRWALAGAAGVAALALGLVPLLARRSSAPTTPRRLGRGRAANRSIE
jgi:MFS family permease